MTNFLFFAFSRFDLIDKVVHFPRECQICCFWSPVHTCDSNATWWRFEVVIGHHLESWPSCRQVAFELRVCEPGLRQLNWPQCDIQRPSLTQLLLLGSTDFCYPRTSSISSNSVIKFVAYMAVWRGKFIIFISEINLILKTIK